MEYDEETLAFEQVEALSEMLKGVVCLIRGRRVCISRRYLLGTAIRKPGDLDTLRLPRPVAASLGLVE